MSCLCSPCSYNHTKSESINFLNIPRHFVTFALNVTEDSRGTWLCVAVSAYLLSCPHTDSPRLTQGLRSERCDASRNLRKSQLSAHIIKYMCIYKPAKLKSQLQHWNLTGGNTTIPPPVIAQQYSSGTFVSLRLHSRKGRNRRAFQKFFRKIFLFEKHLSKIANFNPLGSSSGPS